MAMNSKSREVVESPLTQGTDEQVVYTLDTTNWGGSPTSVSVVAKDGNGNDVTATVLSGSASVASDTITLPTLQNLIANAVYRIEILHTIGGSVFEAFLIVRGET